MQEENKKMNFFNRVIASIKDFEKYQIFAVEGIGKSLKYLVIIMLIFSSVIAVAFTYKFGNSFNNAFKYFKENIGEVSYKDNKLTVNSRWRNNNYEP